PASVDGKPKRDHGLAGGPQRNFETWVLTHNRRCFHDLDAEYLAVPVEVDVDPGCHGFGACRLPLLAPKQEVEEVAFRVVIDFHSGRLGKLSGRRFRAREVYR